MVVVREQAAPPALGDYIKNFARFLAGGKQRGFVREGLDTTMITGAIIDRIISQVLYGPSIEGAYGIDMSDPKYRMHWCTSDRDRGSRSSSAQVAAVPSRLQWGTSQNSSIMP